MNERLRSGCPLCNGTGKVSFLRSGAWLNEWCPGANGPVDRDNAPTAHELDNLAGKRFAVIEYKPVGGQIKQGQALHFAAIAEQARIDWLKLIVLVFDEGQTDSSQEVTSHSWITAERRWSKESVETIESLGKNIAGFVWPRVLEVAA